MFLFLMGRSPENHSSRWIFFHKKKHFPQLKFAMFGFCVSYFLKNCKSKYQILYSFRIEIFLVTNDLFLESNRKTISGEKVVTKWLILGNLIKRIFIIQLYQKSEWNEYIFIVVLFIKKNLSKNFQIQKRYNILVEIWL